MDNERYFNNISRHFRSHAIWYLSDKATLQLCNEKDYFHIKIKLNRNMDTIQHLELNERNTKNE